MESHINTEAAETTEPTAEEPTVREPASVIFMGERIAAPGEYLGIPELYVPILDDIYLYIEVSRRYNSFEFEERRGFNNELSSTEREIRARGYLPFPGGGFGWGVGYAPVDFDGDGSPELLILDNVYRDPLPYSSTGIRSVFAIRNGQLVCIDSGSGDLISRTILTDDGTFYQYSGYIESGIATLRAFRLEAGMSEFTIFFEARAELSFAEDVPVPHWVKIENGEEINISEDEFFLLSEQYRNPNGRMTPAFVPIHGEAFVWNYEPPVPPPVFIQTEYPESYDAPAEFKRILDALYFLELMRGEDIDIYILDEAWGITGFAEPHYGELGFAVADINNDGLPELLLGDIRELNNASPLSIFTLQSGEPVHVTSFWGRSRGAISADGTIYSVGSGGAAYTYLSSYRLNENSAELTPLTNMSSDLTIINEKYYSYFYQVVDGRNRYISEDEFWDFCEEYENPSNPMILTVISIANAATP
jgi:hypothetical protein